VSLPRRKRWGPVEIGAALGLPASTVHAVLTRCRLHRLSHLDRSTGQPVRRYEHEHPGDLLHVDVAAGVYVTLRQANTPAPSDLTWHLPATRPTSGGPPGTAPAHT
jgi:hypothetical protein